MEHASTATIRLSATLPAQKVNVGRVAMVANRVSANHTRSTGSSVAPTKHAMAMTVDEGSTPAPMSRQGLSVARNSIGAIQVTSATVC
jgi:hypothetical protein